MSHKIDHVIQRTQERYGILLTVKDIEAIEWKITQAKTFNREDAEPNNPHGVWRAKEQKDEGGVYAEVWKIKWREHVLRVVWKNGHLTTCLYPPGLGQGHLGRLGTTARITKLKRKGDK